MSSFVANVFMRKTQTLLFLFQLLTLQCINYASVWMGTRGKCTFRDINKPTSAQGCDCYYQICFESTAENRISGRVNVLTLCRG